MKMYLGKKQTSATSRSKRAPKMEMKLLNSSRRLKVFKSAAKGESFAGEKASLRTSKSPRLQLLKKVRVRDGKLSEGRMSVAAWEAKSGHRSRSFDVEGRRADYSDAKSTKVKKEKRLEEVRVRDGKFSEGRKPVAAREVKSGYRSRSFDVEGRRVDYSDARSKKEKRLEEVSVRDGKFSEGRKPVAAREAKSGYRSRSFDVEGRRVDYSDARSKKEERLEEVRVRDGKLSEGRTPVAAREAKSGYRSRSFDVEGRRADDSDGKIKKVKKEKRLEATVEDEKPSRKEARNSFSESAKKSSKRETSKLERGEEASGIGTKSSNGDGKTSGLGEKSKNGIADAEVPMKRKKRVIRIDPYDISNKRLDDGLSASIEKVSEEEITLSQNAQFRAIKPSREILTCVEDNLLGRRRLIELRKTGYNIDISAPLDNIPFSTSAERERIEDNVFRNKLAFFAAAKVSSSFPPPSLPEIAFAGRSNVGKSSLLNALTRQWGVVRTSDKPGLTQTINFFKLGAKLCLVDLPGYGFAYAKEEVKDAWEELVKEYVSTRVGLRRVCLLVDTKWGMKPRDHELINLMERSQTQYQVVLTKTDTVFPIDVARRAMQIQEGLRKNKSIIQPVMMVSSISGAGIRCLRTVLSKIGRVAKI